jgi:hypothetical protein
VITITRRRFLAPVGRRIRAHRPGNVSSHARGMYDRLPHPHICHPERSAAQSKDLHLGFFREGMISHKCPVPILPQFFAEGWETTAPQSRVPHPHLCHPERSAAQSKDLRFGFFAKG